MKKVLILMVVFTLAAGMAFAEEGHGHDYGKEWNVKPHATVQKGEGGHGHDHSEKEEKVAASIKKLKYGHTPGLLFAIALLIFTYGLLHGTGVAHGNAIISGWIMASRQKYSDVVVASVLTGLFHALTATIVVMIVWFVLEKAIEVEKLHKYIRIIAGSMVLLIGVYILTTFIIAKLKKEQTCCHGHGHGVNIKEGKINPVLLALGAGIVPCPITSSILIAALGFGLMWQGLVFVAAFAAGMSLSLLGISSAVWYLTERTSDIKFLRLAHIMDNILHIVGPAIVITIGVFLLSPYIF